MLPSLKYAENAKKTGSLETSCFFSCFYSFIAIAIVISLLSLL
jgi:hypothetical protein